MTREGLILVLSLALIFEWEGSKGKGLLPDLGSKTLKETGFQTLEFLGCLLFLLLLYLFMAEIWIPCCYQKKWVILFSIPTAYVLSVACKRSAAFFLALFLSYSAILFTEEAFSFSQRMLDAFLLAVFLFILRIFLKGMKWRLGFSNVPEPMKGLPIFLFIASLIALAFSWFG